MALTKRSLSSVLFENETHRITVEEEPGLTIVTAIKKTSGEVLLFEHLDREEKE